MIPGQGAKILLTAQCGQKGKKKGEEERQWFASLKYIDFLTLGEKSLMREDNSYTDKGIVQPLQI